VVFNTGADPVKMGLVTNVRQPGGNVTGITFFSEELGAKALSLLRELVKTSRDGLDAHHRSMLVWPSYG
jgi:ABC-type uncharacterized transport system substrate-binding protein